MSLTSTDIQALKQAFQPEFDRIDKRFEQIDLRFEQIDLRFEEVYKRFDEIDLRFEAVDDKFDQQHERMMSGFREIMGDVFPEFDKYDIRLDDHEERIGVLENA